MIAVISNIFVVTHATFWTLYYSVLSVFINYTVGYNRQRTDQHLKGWAKKLLTRIGLKYKIFKQSEVELQQGRAYIIMCNHSSFYDIPLTYVSLEGSIRMVAKKELFRVPIWGKAMEMTEFIKIDRNDPRQSKKDLQIAMEKLQTGLMLWIAPEGTRSRTGEMLPFKKGGFKVAMDMMAIIIPMGIRGVNKVFPPNT
ncbi:MAG: 1-acyl-sn-glycerol-3-phosphate acyltransferase, partial [Deltaproteobacteria bacterium]|nr:1-acyl-sn-glycerol-3-phosphate acyltransferase [Deltaproteobacteria bacterium]